ncbi:MAG TPA: DUF6607 family protein [Allosphingosinicella sp.]|nr:DUF6607 family protein [Allosphingosinicella sp.]
MKPVNLLLLAAAALAPAPALAQPAPAAPAASGPIDQPADFEASRRAILGMAGTFRVRFDMRETTSWRADYTARDATSSGGHEVVRVIGDTGRFISLQHLLVVEHEGQPMVIKHWRQDWTYEPETVLVYAGPNRWRTEAIPAARRRGAWSQTVWQVDDSPRYGGLGRWTNTGGVMRWQSDWTWRPLARRDAVRTPRYDRYLSINRHSPTPDGGWIHWQDNEKMGLVDGRLSPFVQESLLNTYRPFSEFNVAAADTYWAATRDYWAAVRAEWTRVEGVHRGIDIIEEAQAGTVISGRLLEMGGEIQAGRMQTPAAIAEATRLIREATGGR